MALDGSYAGLKASIADLLNRTDLSAAIPDFIALAEAQMARRFVSRMKDGEAFPRRLVNRADAPVAAGAEYVAVPPDFLGPLELLLEPLNELDFVGIAVLQRLKSRGRWAGAPKWYAVVGGQFQLYPPADQAYTAELTYVSRVPGLSDAAPSNWILEDYPDVYLYGAATASAPYLKDDGRISMWGTLFTTAIDDICNADPMPTGKSILQCDVPSSRWHVRTDH